MDSWIHVIACLLGIISHLPACQMQVPQEVCQWQTFNASCSGDQVILMTSARYGRMRVGTCMQRDYFIGCSANVIVHADERCSGRKSCTIPVPDANLHALQPCPRDIGAYLEAAYQCVDVSTAKGHQCHSFKPLVVESQSGFLSSLVAEQSGLGAGPCPWIVRVGQGQRVNLTLYDFGVLQHDKDDSNICTVYVTVSEKGRERETTVCGGRHRLRPMYTSESSEVQVNFIRHSTSEDKPYFLIKYEAVGCVNLPVPQNGWLERSGDSLTLGCNYTSDKWHLVCRGTQWVGEYHNCTSPSVSRTWGLSNPTSDPGRFPYGLMISVVIGVVLGVVFGTTMLFLVLACRKKKYGHGRSSLLVPEGIQYSPRDMNYIASQKYAGLQSTDPNHSTYAHIWEVNNVPSSLPLNTMQTSDLKSGTLTNNSTDSGLSPDYQLQGNIRRPFLANHSREMHVYESPKLSRKESSDKVGEGVPYYHEFDVGENDTLARVVASAHGTRSTGRLPELGPSSKSE